MKQIISVLMTVMLILSLSACSSSILPIKKSESEASTESKKSESRVKNIFKDINEESGIHMKYSVETNGVNIEQDIYKKGDQLYEDTLAGDTRVVMIVNASTVYMLDDSSKTAIKADLTEEQKTQIESAMSSVDGIFEAGTSNEEFTEGTVKIDGMIYDTEEYSSDEASGKFVFNDDGDLVYVMASAGGQEVKIKIDVLEGNVPDKQFEIPEGYQVVDINGKPVTDNPADKSGTDETKSEASTANSSGTDTTGGSASDSNSTPTAQNLQTVTSEAGGFSFRTGSNYIINISGQYVDVYLKTQSTAPAFHVYPMIQVNDQTVDDFNDATIEQVKKNQQNKLTGEPEKITITVNDKEIKGFRYSYSTDDGKDIVMAENYLDLIDGTFYSWGCSYMKGDSVTPVELRSAMQSFQLK